MKIHINRILLLFTAIILVVFFSISCARQVMLSGGPKDVDPPEVLYSEPENGSVNFDQSRIRIYFDEYIRLVNLSQKLIISPPIEPEPDIFLRGKSIIIDLEPDKLEENTTYSLNFNDAIVDLNEGNAIHSFIFAFSTGEFIDSLQVSGIVYDAYTKKPVEDVFVMLHSNLSDTAFRTKRPTYLTKVDKNGEFLIPFIKEGEYNIFALDDANFNYKFDLIDERIAFYDTSIFPRTKIIEKKVEPDSLSIDIDNDSIINNELKDSVITKVRFLPNDIELLLFTEDYETQFVKDRKRPSRENIIIFFNRKQYQDFNVKVENDEDALLVYSENPDTVNIWLKDEELISKDTVRVFLNYYSHHNPDSLISDTLRVRGRDFKKDTVLNYSAPRTKHPAKDFTIRFEYPIKYVDNDLASLYYKRKDDTAYTAQVFDFKIDSLNPLNIKLLSDFDEDKNYKLILHENFAESYYGLCNIADTIKFGITPESDFATVVVSIPESNENYIIQLLKNDEVKYEVYADNNLAEFFYVKPDSYTIKMLIDLNKNQRWDTGNFDDRIQPEPVLFFPEKIEVRSNWVHEYDWVLDVNDNNN